MTALLEAWIKLFGEPLTWRRLVLLSAILGVIAAAIVLFEYYTWTFRLGRLEKATALIVRLQESEARGTNDSVEIRKARKLLIDQTLHAIESKPITIAILPTTVNFSMDGVWKFLAAGTLWYLMVLIQLRKWRSPSDRKDLLSQLFIAGLAGAVATFVPAIWWPWFHILVYPWLFIAVILLAIAPVAATYQFWSALKKAKQRAQSASCIVNLKHLGLSARLWASQHGGVLPVNVSQMREQLGTEEVTRCTADRSRHYEILSPGASEDDPSVVYARCPLHNHVVLTDGSAHQLRDQKFVTRNGKLRVEKDER